MKKNILYKSLSFCIAAVMGISLAACGGKGSSGNGNSSNNTVSQTAAKIDKDMVYSEQIINFEDTAYNVNDIRTLDEIGEELYAAGSHYNYVDENTPATSDLFIARFSKEGALIESKTLAEKLADTSFVDMKFDTDGNLYIIKQTGRRSYDSDTQQNIAGSEFVDDSDKTGTQDNNTEDTSSSAGEIKFYMVKYDREGNVVYESEFTKEAMGLETDGYYVSDIHYLEGKGILVTDSSGVSLFSNEDGKFIKRIYETYSTEFCVTGSGRLFLKEDGSLREIDINTGDISKELNLNTDIKNNLYNLKTGTAHDFIYSDDEGIKVWNVGDSEVKQVLSFSDSDLAVSYLNQVVEISDTEFFALYNNSSDYSDVLSVFTKVDPDSVVEKQVITLGVDYSNDSLRNAVVDFNKSNSNYRVKIIDYSKFNTEEDYNAGINKLNSDLISGSGPDMISLGSGNGIENYASKGVLEPLDDYLANDPELGKKEFVTKVFDAYRYKGKMYVAIPSFTVYTYAIKKADADKITVWDMKALDNLIKNGNGDYSTAFGYQMTKDIFLQSSVIFDISSYIDTDNGKAMFDTQQFKDLLTFANNFPKDYKDGEDVNTGSLYRENKAVVAQAYMNNFYTFAQMKYGNFGEDISLIGFPGEGGKSSNCVMAEVTLAINSGSTSKEASWEFIKHFLGDEYQNTIVKGEYQFPVGKSQLDELAKKSMQKRTYTDAEGNEVEDDDSYTINGEEVKIPPLSQADVDQMYSLIDGITTSMKYDQKIMNILSEESAPFFNGQKSVDECASVIQSKIQIYLDETR